VTARILIAEDDPNILNLLYVFLSQQGYTVEKATDGREALRLAAAITPDLLITDVMMPHMNGYQLVNAIVYERVDIPTPKIIMLTSRTDPSDVQRGLDVGVDMYIPKPFDIAEVTARVAELLSEGKAKKD